MTNNKKLAPHEMFELHEILTFKNVCATKSSAMAGLVSDDDLKTILQDDFDLSRQHIKDLQFLLQSQSS